MNVYFLLAAFAFASTQATRGLFELSRGRMDESTQRTRTAPATCESLAETIAFLQSLLETCTGRSCASIQNQLLNAQAEYNSACQDTIVCPIFKWIDYDFDVYVNGDFSAPSSDVEGMLMVGGDLTLKGYSIGEKIDGGVSVLVGGDVSWHTGRLMFGNMIYGGEAILGTSVLNGLASDQVVQQADGVVNFEEATSWFLYVSQYLTEFSGRYTKGSILRGSAHSITCETLGQLHNLEIVSDTWAVINVRGADCALSNLGVTTTAGCENTFFNFPDALSISISEVHIPGCVSAPNADIIGSSGVILGQVVAKSFTGSTQFNKCRCTACPQ